MPLERRWAGMQIEMLDTDMLRSCFGDAAGYYPSPREWAQTAVPFLLKLGPKDNGKPRSVG
jgi:hypothetical protein